MLTYLIERTIGIRQLLRKASAHRGIWLTNLILLDLLITLSPGCAVVCLGTFIGVMTHDGAIMNLIALPSITLLLVALLWSSLTSDRLRAKEPVIRP